MTRSHTNRLYSDNGNELATETTTRLPAALVIRYLDTSWAEKRIVYSTRRFIHAETLPFDGNDPFDALLKAVKNDLDIDLKDYTWVCKINDVEYHVINERALDGVVELARAYSMPSLELDIGYK